MSYPSYSSGRRAPRKSRRGFFLTAALVAISMSPIALFADLDLPDYAPRPAPQAKVLSGRVPVPEVKTTGAIRLYDRALVDPSPVLKPDALALAHNAPLSSAFVAAPMRREAALAQPVAPAASEVVPEAEEIAQAMLPVPLPVPRPADLGLSKPSIAPQVARARIPTPTRSTALASAPSTPMDDRSFFEKLFGVRTAPPVPDTAMSYASIDTGAGSLSPRGSVGMEPGTAIYNITAMTVTMPNGEKLEAHSGLGDKMDDPRFVHVRMKGATPPGTYILKEREALFHGVRAIRMNPVGGSAAIHGRDGILAHTYMLGPRGDSNGCISFKNYDRFLQAYLRGEVKRIVVVTGRQQDMLPRIVNNRTSGRNI